MECGLGYGKGRSPRRLCLRELLDLKEERSDGRKDRKEGKERVKEEGGRKEGREKLDGVE